MNAWKLSVLLVSIWTLLHFWLYPMLVKHWTSGELSTKVTRAGVLAGLEMLCNLTLRVAVVLGIVLGVLWLLDVLALSEHVFPQFAIAAAVSASTFLGTVSSGFSKFVLIASLAGAAFVLYRTARHAQSIVRGKLIEQVLAQRNAFAADPDSLFRLAEDENFRPQVEELTVILAQRDAIAKESPAKQEKRQEELQFLESAIEARLQTIAFLVVKPKFDPVEALRTADPSPAEPARRGMLPMIGRLFASKGFAKDLGLIRTSFDRVASALLVLSLLTWAAEPLANSFRLTANNLQVTFEKQAAKQLLDEALSKAQPAPAPPTSMESVNQATRTIARAFVDQTVRRNFAETLGIERTEAKKYKEEAIRAAILDAKAEVSTSAGAEERIRSESLNEDVHAGGRNRKGKALAEKLEPSVAEYARTVEQKSSGLWRRMAERAERRYAAQMDVWEAQGKLVTQAVGQAIGAIDFDASSEIARQGQRVVQEIGKKALSTWADAKLQEFMANLMRDVAIEGFGDPALRANLALRDETRELLRGLSESAKRGDESLDTFTLTSSEDARSRKEMVENIENVGRNLSPDSRETLLGYDSVYPGGGGGGGGSEGHVRKKRRALMSTSFMHAARGGFTRGVVIGRDVEEGKLQFTDVRWSRVGSAGRDAEMFQIEVRTLDGGWKSLGRFHESTINQSLRYAADKRVVAVTMVPAAPIAGLAIYLHPVLADTALGCRVTKSDRFVDMLGRSLPELDRNRAAVSSFAGLYRVMAEARTKVCQDSADSGKLWSQLANASQVPAGFIANLRTATATHGATARFVDQVVQCSKANSDAMKECVCGMKPELSGSQDVYTPIDVTSQVRERPFKATPDLGWMRPSENALGHVEFWLHMILARTHANGSGEGSDNTDTIAMDFSQADLALLNRELPKLVRQYIVGSEGLNQDYKSFMQPLEEFVVMQRFFRLALSSRFSDKFPSYKLVALERETRGLVKKQTTLRWQAPDVEQSQRQLEQLKIVAPAEYDHVLQFMRAARDKSSGVCAPI